MVFRRRRTRFHGGRAGWHWRFANASAGHWRDASATRWRGLFRPEGVAKILGLFDSDAMDLAYPIWALLSLEVWCQETLDQPG